MSYQCLFCKNGTKLFGGKYRVNRASNLYVYKADSSISYSPAFSAFMTISLCVKDGVHTMTASTLKYILANFAVIEI